MLDRILPVEDEEVSAFVAKDFARQGMTILTGHRTTALDVNPGRGVVATLSGTGGAREPRDFSHVIVAVGIVPHTANYGLDTSGLQMTRWHVIVNEYVQTKEPSVGEGGD